MKPDSSSPAPVVRDQSQFKRILSRNVGLPLFAGLLSAVLFAFVVGYLSEVLAHVEETDQVIITASRAEKLIVDMETGMRGYLLSGEKEFLQPYREATKAFGQTFNELTRLTADPAQVSRLAEIDQLQREWQSFAEKVIATKAAGGDVAALVRSREGFKRSNAMLDLFDGYIGRERRERIERNATATRTANWLISSFLGVSMLISGILAWRGRRELLALSDTYDEALADQRAHAEQLEQQTWQRGGQTQLADRLLGQLPLSTLGDNTLAFLAEYLDVSVAALYCREPNGDLRLTASYGMGGEQRKRKALLNADEGLVARCVKDRRAIQLNGLGADYLQISSGTVEGPARTVLLVPLSHEGAINGVLELGFLRPIAAPERELAESLGHTVGASIEAARYRERLHNVLEETQQLNEELQAQQEELRSANEELEAQARVLQESQVNLEEQQTQLEHANEQLAERGEELLAQRDALNQRNAALREAQLQLEARARELAEASRYKSEFLANMSHELRTPLNSSLILARLLADNAGGNLDQEQVRYAESIYSAGNDLLALINDILDISKVEAGKLDVHPSATPLTRLIEGLETTFRTQAVAKGLGFQLVVEGDVPEQIVTDRQRLEQILRNLLSNAIKFTEHGSVTVTVADGDESVLFQVRDTGIGIPAAQQGLIFDAFHQADGTINRRFGGTGLGLSISRDLARLLGGDIAVSSEPGVGSTFTLTLPKRFAQQEGDEPTPARAPASTSFGTAATTTRAVNAPVPRRKNDEPAAAPAQPLISDDRASDLTGRRCVLVVEDEPTFAKILYDLAHELGYRCLVAGSADEGIALALQFTPNAVLLDMKLPDHSGLTVLERLKAEAHTRHIPIHVISVEDRWQPAMQLGAIGYAMKPTSREELKAIFARLEARLDQKVKRVLLVEDDPRQREAVTLLISDNDVEITAVESGAQALGQLKSTVFDCMIVDLQLPDMQGKELLDAMSTAEICSFPPVIVYTGRNLSADEEADLMRYSRSIIIKGARSPERLLDEVTLFLHKVESDLSVERRSMLKAARSHDRTIEGRRILLVDDDVRNLFALTSALESKGAQVEIARNGREALEKLDANSDIDLVLMDVMMPEMDGYEAMQAIRAQQRWRRLPVIAVTAKAMKDDQERCLQAGANDYMAKPIDLDRLFSLIRVWLPKLERA